jgi:glycosyltransferase involved in cell wall biosynthesis
VILNSLTSQFIEFSHPLVKVINLPNRPATLGETRNLCIQQCSGDYIAVVDDDDVILPNYLAWLADHLGDMDWLRMGSKFSIRAGKVEKLGGAANNQIAFRKATWEKLGGYPSVNSGEDVGFTKLLIQKSRGKTVPCEPREVGFIYRFGHGFANISACGRDKEGQPTGLDQCERRLKQRPTTKGRIVLNPGWRMDYWRMTRKWLSENGYSL